MRIVDMTHQCGIPFLLHLARPMLRKAHQERSQRFLSRQALDVLHQFIYIGPGVGVDLRVLILSLRCGLSQLGGVLGCRCQLILKLRGHAFLAFAVLRQTRFEFELADHNVAYRFFSGLGKWSIGIAKMQQKPKLKTRR